MQQLASFFQQHFPADENEKPTGEKTKIAISPVDIEEIQMQQGNILIQDNRLKPNGRAMSLIFPGNYEKYSLCSFSRQQ